MSTMTMIDISDNNGGDWWVRLDLIESVTYDAGGSAVRLASGFEHHTSVPPNTLIDRMRAAANPDEAA